MNELDPDIAAATPEQLARIRAQIALNTSNKVSASLTELSTELASLDAVELLDYKRRVMLVLIPKYMTTSTAIDPLLIEEDAKKDAARLAAAYKAVIAIPL